MKFCRPKSFFNCETKYSWIWRDFLYKSWSNMLVAKCGRYIELHDKFLRRDGQLVLSILCGRAKTNIRMVLLCTFFSLTCWNKTVIHSVWIFRVPEWCVFDRSDRRLFSSLICTHVRVCVNAYTPDNLFTYTLGMVLLYKNLSKNYCFDAP